MTVSILQEVQNSQSATATSISVAITTAGGTYLDVRVAMGNNPATTLTSVTDGTNTYRLAPGTGQFWDSAAGTGTAVYVSTAIVAAGTYTVKANFSATTTFIAILVAEIAGTSGCVGSVGQFQTSPTTGANATTTGATPIAQIPGLMYALTYSPSDNSANTAGSGFTSLGYQWVNIFTTSLTEYQVLSSGVPVAATFTAAANTVRISMASVWGQTGGIMAVSAASAAFVNSLSTAALPTRAGDAAVVWIQTVSAQPLSGFTDTAGNTWNGTVSPAYNVTASGVHYYVYLVWAQNIIANAANVLTASVSGGPAQISMNAQFHSGRTTSGALFDGSVSTYSDGSGTTSHSPGPSVTTSFAGSNLAMMAFDANTVAETFTPTSGYTVSTQNVAGTYFTSFAQYLLNQSANTYAAPWTTANTDVGLAIMVALLAAPTTTSGHNNLLLMGVG